VSASKLLYLQIALNTTTTLEPFCQLMNTAIGSEYNLECLVSGGAQVMRLRSCNGRTVHNSTVPVFTSSGHAYPHGFMDQLIHISKGLFSLELPFCSVSSEQSHRPRRREWERKCTCSKVQFQTTGIPSNRSRCGSEARSYSALDRAREKIT
jgi:hypothetical protein